MREAWVSESLTFCVSIIKHAITKKFGWLEPSNFLCDGRTFGAQIAPRSICIYFGNRKHSF